MYRPILFWFALAFGIACLSVPVGPGPTPLASWEPQKPGASGVKEPRPPGLKPIALEVVDLPGYEKRLAGLKGKFVAVDAWATWCIPCVKKFPQFVELSKKYGRRNVAFVSFSADDVSDKDQALKFLQKHQARFIHLLVTTELAEVQEKLSFEGIPHYFLYDRAGKIVLRTIEIEQLAAALAKRVKPEP